MCAWKTRCLLALVVLVPLVAAGPCTVSITPSDGGNGDGTPPPSSTEITVRVKNETDRPLNPQIYVGPVSEGRDALFQGHHQRTDFGVGNVGILTAGTEGSFTITCGDPVYIATKGGIFGDDLTDPAGRGQQTVLEEDVNVRCGDMVTFLFANDGDTLIVGYGVTPQ